MGYNTSNTAFAFDMQAVPSYEANGPAAPLPRRREQGRPRFDVYTGNGREASQGVSPEFMHVVKVVCVLAVLFLVVGLARVTLASVTTAELNANADLSTQLTEARDQSSDLEVMRSVYGADTRIRDLATQTLGMVEPEGRVTLDVTPQASADASASASAGTAQQS